MKARVRGVIAFVAGLAGAACLAACVGDVRMTSAEGDAPSGDVPGGAAAGSSGSGKPPAGGPPAGSPVGPSSPGSSGSGCTLSIEPLSFPSLAPLPVGAKVRVRAQSASAAAPRDVRWVVTALTGAYVDVQPAADDPLAIDVPLQMAGAYDVSLDATVDGRACRVSKTAVAVAAGLDLYVVRVTPAAGDLSSAPQDLALSVSGGKATLDPILGAVEAAPVEWKTMAGAIEPCFLRLFRGGSAVFEGSTVGSTLALLPGSSYDALFVPHAAEVAPVWLPRVSAGALRPAGGVSPAVTVTGVATTRDDAPAFDVSALLRGAPLTSTIARTTATGSFSLKVRPGTFALELAAPRDLGLPDVRVPNLSFAAGDPETTVAFRWPAVSSARLSIVVRGGAGGKDAAPAGTRVHLSLDPIPQLGTLTLKKGAAAATTIGAEGGLRLSRTIDAAGTAVFAKVPLGRYTAILVPPDAAGDVAVARRSVTLAADLTTDLVLGTKVDVRGRFQAAAAGGQVVALALPDDSGFEIPRAPVTAPIGADGGWSLSLDEGRRYAIVARPIKVAPAVVRASFEARATDLGDIVLPEAIPLESAFRTATGTPLAGAKVQVFCSALQPTCTAPDVPLVETRTDAAGRIGIAIPASRVR